MGSPVRAHMRVRRTGGWKQVGAKVEASSAMLSYRYAIRVQHYARTFAPVDTGRLKASIRAEKKDDGWEIKVGAYYGIYVEYGTRYMAAQPYFRPAIRLAKQDMRKEFKAIFR